MHVMILGAGGMIGRRLAQTIARTGALAGQTVARMTLADIAPPPRPEGFDGTIDLRAVDVTRPGAATDLAARRPDLIYHLAAVVSGEAEADFDKGYRVNLDGFRFLLDAIRAEGAAGDYRPRLIFTSSLAVFGGDLPEVLPDDQFRLPQSSYGAQKVIGEVLLDDYSRRGVIDGIGLRLPTICIRPGAPNKAASGFYSSILREPLKGARAVLPVDDDLRHWFASPRAAVKFLLHAAGIDSAALGPHRTLNLPGVSATVADQLAALERAAGPAALDLIDRIPDPAIAAIVRGWPTAFDPARALALGFRAEANFDEIIAAHLADEAEEIAARA